MRILAAAIVIGPLVLMGALPAAAGPTVLSDTVIQLAAANDAPSDRDTYTRKAHEEMQVWQKKLQDFGDSAQAKGQEASNAAGKELNEAWTKTEAASRELQNAGDEGWERAKITYEHASHDLAEAWHKANPDDK